MVATNDREAQRQPSEYVPYHGASGLTYYKDTMIMKDGAGVIRPASVGAGASNATFLGVNDDKVTLTNGLAGASNVHLNVWKTGEFTFKSQGTGATAHIGEVGYIIDDETVGTSAGYPRLVAGEIVGIPTTSTYRVRITNAVGGKSKFSDGISTWNFGGVTYEIPTSAGTSGDALVQGTSVLGLTWIANT
jgi:hypothetical protein